MAGGVAGFADEVGEAYAFVGVAEEMEVRGEQGGEVGDTVLVAYGVLREALGPALDDGEDGRGDGAEDLPEFGQGQGGDLVVGEGGDLRGLWAPEEGSEETLAGWDAVGELLVDKGGCEEVGVFALRDEEAEAFGEVKGLIEGECYEDGGGGFEVEKGGEFRVGAGEDSAGGRGGSGQDEVVVGGEAGKILDGRVEADGLYG